MRHGETIWHAENRYAGRSDIGLTSVGQTQANQLGEWAGSAQFDALWTSPMKRARATVAPVERCTGLQAQLDERLREVDFGRGEGLTRTQMERQFGAELRAFLHDPALHPLPEGEDPSMAAERAVECLHDIASTNRDQRILVVGHNTLFRLALCKLLDISLSKYRTVFPMLRNGAVTEIAMNGSDTSLLHYNVPVLNFMSN